MLALLVAVSVTVVETVADAVNVAAVAVVDDKAPAPLASHETPEPVESLATLALNACAWPESMVTAVGETATVIGNWVVPDEDDPPLQPVKIADAATAMAIHAAILLVVPASAKNIVELFIGRSPGADCLDRAVRFLPSTCNSGISSQIPSCRRGIFFLLNDFSPE